MIIDSTYFTGPLMIASLGSVGVLNTVNDYIENHEPELLSRAIGESLTEALYQAIEDLGSDEELDPKWQKLLTGEVFTARNGRRTTWKGLAPTLKGGPIAAYVWFHYNRDISMQTAAIGTVQTQAENSNVISGMQVQSKAWNSMVYDLLVLWEYLATNLTTYTEYVSSERDTRAFGTINQFGI